MEKKAAAAEIKRLRAQAKDKSIPQEARNEMLDRANAIELEFYDKAVKEGKTMSKGGAVKKKGYMYGGDATKMNGMHKMPDGSMMKDSAMAKGGAVKKMAYGGDAIKMNGMHKMPDGSMMKDSDMKHGGAVKKMSYGGTPKKEMTRQSPVVAVMIGLTDKKKPVKKMSNGGYANCGASVKAAGGK